MVLFPIPPPPPVLRPHYIESQIDFINHQIGLMEKRGDLEKGGGGDGAVGDRNPGTPEMQQAPSGAPKVDGHIPVWD